MFADPALVKLATTAGLAVSWVDAFGQAQMVKAQTLHNVLEALGLPCSTPQQCVDTQRLLTLPPAAAPLPPLITGDEGQGICLPAGAAFHGMPYQIRLESGQILDGQFTRDISSALQTQAIAQVGYHQLLVAGQQITLAVAPPTCFVVGDLRYARPHKIWAPSVQLYSLRDEGDGGLGTYTALEKLAGHVGRAGASALAISPVHAMFSADPHRYSPYGPSSRMQLNVFHIDPAAVLGEQAYRDAMRSMPELASLNQDLVAKPLVDWPASTRIRLKLLRHLFDRIRQGSAEMQAAFRTFQASGGQALQHHAIYEALLESMREQGNGDDWRQWPAEYQHPDCAGVQSFARQYAQEVEFHAFLQWQAALGLQRAQQAGLDAGMPIGLIYDMAVGADPQGSQAWMRREQFLQGLSVGAPPDLFFREGQSWGINALSSHGLRQHGFQAYIEMLRAAFQYAGGVRIDHVLGLVRLWLVPEGGSAQDGVYLHYPSQDLLRLIRLESQRHRAIVIGEDLGTVPAGSRELFAQAGIMGMNVLWFERDGNAFVPPISWNKQSIATTGTHDMATVMGWWKGLDIELLALPPEQLTMAWTQREQDKQQLIQALRPLLNAGPSSSLAEKPPSDAQLLDAVLAYVARNQAPLTIIPMEDLLGIEEQANLPGTTDSQPNWRRRLPHTLSALIGSAVFNRRLAIINATPA